LFHLRPDCTSLQEISSDCVAEENTQNVLESENTRNLKKGQDFGHVY